MEIRFRNTELKDLARGIGDHYYPKGVGKKYRYEHPGVGLEMALEENNLTQKQFAELIGKTAVEVNQIINGRRNITLDWAMRISAVFGGNPKHWVEMQADYDQQEYQKSDKYSQLLQIQKRARAIIPVVAKS